MSVTLARLSDLAAAGFDDIIDARSPAEYAEDHLPGALSLPVLSDAERAEVGTMYVRVSRFGARRMGAAMVARNIAAHLDGPLADRDGGWRPLVYCWRGGQRSGTFTLMLREIGWRAEALEGGYRAWRRLVVRDLYDLPLPHRLLVLSGMTCTAKTALLPLLRARGMQVIDLEGLAAHRGSVFGAVAEAQPGQKAFEARLALALAALDPGRPVVVEAESSRIGERNLPPEVWKAMRAAPRVEVTAPLGARAAFAVRAYADIAADPAAVAERIGRLRPIHGAAQVEAWQGMARDGALAPLAADLMQRHYDPRYAKSQARQAGGIVGEVALDDLSPEVLEVGADRLADALRAADAQRAAPAVRAG